MICVITPVYNSHELASQYARAVRGAEVVIVDNGSEPEAARVWAQTAIDLGGHYIRNEANRWYAAACNQGYAVSTGDVMVFMNNDIVSRGDWLPTLEKIDAGALYGPGLNIRTLAGQPLIYLDAWWIAARRETWRKLGTIDDGIDGPWDAQAFHSGMYWEDVDLCFRATRQGIALRTVSLPLAHLSNYTSGRTPGAYAHTDSNGGDSMHRDICEARVRAWQEAAR